MTLLAVAGALVAGTSPGRAATPPPLAWNPATPLAVEATGTNGESRVLGDGLACDGDTPVDDVHLSLASTVPGGTVSSLPATLTANLGLAGHRLEPTTSHVTLGDERGTLSFQLDGGACPNSANLTPNGADLVGTGAATLTGGTGSYHDATFTGGTWNLATATDPGADNPWSLDLDGQLAALTPGLQVELLTAYWANLGLDYVTRTVTVQFRITNPGPGDSYGSALTAVTAGPGVTVLGPLPQGLGDLLAGESRVVTIRYRLALLGPPCQLIVLGCQFNSTLATSLPDAFDGPTNRAATVGVAAPDLPPPL